jgi:hypothetical protein
VLGESYALVVVVQPIYLQFAGRKGRIQVATKYETTIVFIFRDIRAQIKFGNIFVNGVESSAGGKHY